MPASKKHKAFEKAGARAARELWRYAARLESMGADELTAEHAKLDAERGALLAVIDAAESQHSTP
jgi:hypothetical protein